MDLSSFTPLFTHDKHNRRLNIVGHDYINLAKGDKFEEGKHSDNHSLSITNYTQQMIECKQTYNQINDTFLRITAVSGGK